MHFTPFCLLHLHYFSSFYAFHSILSSSMIKLNRKNVPVTLLVFITQKTKQKRLLPFLCIRKFVLRYHLSQKKVFHLITNNPIPYYPFIKKQTPCYASNLLSSIIVYTKIKPSPCYPLYI
jgi:hypothetical protein